MESLKICYLGSQHGLVVGGTRSDYCYVSSGSTGASTAVSLLPPCLQPQTAPFLYYLVDLSGKLLGLHSEKLNKTFTYIIIIHACYIAVYYMVVVAGVILYYNSKYVIYPAY